MKKLLILGGGTAGTMVANRLAHELDRDEWQITIVDQTKHYYQPGFLFIPFGIYCKRRGEGEARLPAPRHRGHHLRRSRSSSRTKARAHLQGQSVSCLRLPDRRHRQPRVPDETPGMPKTSGTSRSSTSTRSRARARCASICARGRAGGSSSTSPRCPSSARSRRWSSSCLADWFFHEQGIRDGVDLTLVTPLPGLSRSRWRRSDWATS